jgi:hypothetical protein
MLIMSELKKKMQLLDTLEEETGALAGSAERLERLAENWMPRILEIAGQYINQGKGK